MRVNIIFSDTPFPTIIIIVFIHISRKLIKLSYNVSVSYVLRYIFFMQECGSNVQQFNVLQAHQASAKTLQKRNLTLNKMHDLTENQILFFYGRR